MKSQLGFSEDGSEKPHFGDDDRFGDARHSPGLPGIEAGNGGFPTWVVSTGWVFSWFIFAGMIFFEPFLEFLGKNEPKILWVAVAAII